MPRANVNDWLAQTLRLTAFPSEPPVIERNWWQEVVGEMPESRTVQPKLLKLQEGGLLDGIRIIHEAQPIRIDWHLLKDENPETDEIDSLGHFSVALEKYQDILSRWLKVAPLLKRIAFGAVLLLPVESREVGYLQIGDYLPFRPDPDSSDFAYQINRKRDSSTKVDRLKINRLSKWSVARMLRAHLSVNVEQAEAEVGLLPVEKSACRIELDINTASEFRGVLPANQLNAIFSELVDFGIEIVREGDIR